MTKENGLIIFAKLPEIGRCKTRISRTFGDQFAFDFSRACLNDLVDNLSESENYDIVFGVDTQREAELFQDAYGYSGVLTSRGNQPVAINDKFNNLFSELIRNRFKRVVLIPMDLPFLREADIKDAFMRLERKPYALGPEFNGGIYLMGASRPYQNNIFRGVRFSTPESSLDFANNCGYENLSVMQRMNDLNTQTELFLERERISKDCPRVFALLKSVGIYAQTHKLSEVLA